MTGSRTLGLPSGITPEPGDDDQPPTTHPHNGTAATPRHSRLPQEGTTKERKAQTPPLDRPRSFMDDLNVQMRTLRMYCPTLDVHFP